MSEYGIVPIDRSGWSDPEALGLKGCSVTQGLTYASPASFSVRDLEFVPPFWEREDTAKEHVHADLHVFEALWKHRLWLTPWYKDKIPMGSSFFQFYCDGVSVLNEYGVECVLYLRYGPDLYMPKFGKQLEYGWFWGWTPIGKNWGHYFPAVVLPPHSWRSL